MDNNQTTTISKSTLGVLSFLAGSLLTLVIGNFVAQYAAKHGPVTNPFMKQTALSKLTPSLPRCIPDEILSHDDKSVITFIIKYNETISHKLSSLQKKLTTTQYKELVASELAREEGETALMKSLYKETYKEEYNDTQAASSLLKNYHFPDDIATQPGLTEADMMSLFRGALEHVDNGVYAPLILSSKNVALLDDAKRFEVFKGEVVRKLGGGK